jgi:hypothetical protein
VALVVLLAGCKDGPAGQKSRGPTEEELRAMREECSRIMPKSFASIWIGMTEQDLITERPEAKHQAHRTDPLERRWYNEMSQTGVSVWYGVDRETERLAVVQFAHRFVSWEVFSAHAEVLQDRFGTGYELYTCPGATQGATMTRLLWARQPLAVMEAVLEVGNSISVTMLVSKVEHMRTSIEKQKCVRMDKEKAMEAWIEERVEAEKAAQAEAAKQGHAHGPTPPPGATSKADEMVTDKEDPEGQDERPPTGGETPAEPPKTNGETKTP